MRRFRSDVKSAITVMATRVFGSLFVIVILASLRAAHAIEEKDCRQVLRSTPSREESRVESPVIKGKEPFEEEALKEYSLADFKVDFQSYLEKHPHLDLSNFDAKRYWDIAGNEYVVLVPKRKDGLVWNNIELFDYRTRLPIRDLNGRLALRGPRSTFLDLTYDRDDQEFNVEHFVGPMKFSFDDRSYAVEKFLEEVPRKGWTREETLQHQPFKPDDIVWLSHLSSARYFTALGLGAAERKRRYIVSIGDVGGRKKIAVYDVKVKRWYDERFQEIYGLDLELSDGRMLSFRPFGNFWSPTSRYLQLKNFSAVEMTPGYSMRHFVSDFFEVIKAEFSRLESASASDFASRSIVLAEDAKGKSYVLLFSLDESERISAGDLFQMNPKRRVEWDRWPMLPLRTSDGRYVGNLRGGLQELSTAEALAGFKSARKPIPETFTELHKAKKEAK